jgi:hypothetical protein
MRLAKQQSSSSALVQLLMPPCHCGGYEKASATQAVLLSAIGHRRVKPFRKLRQNK